MLPQHDTDRGEADKGNGRRSLLSVWIRPSSGQYLPLSLADTKQNIPLSTSRN
jgi:hypothetical protein